MTPPNSLITWLLESPWLRKPTQRRIIFAVLALTAGLLCFYPEHYQAEAELMPQEGGGGLSAVLAQQSSGAILDLGALVGNKTSIDADLAVARSEAVVDGVIANMSIVGRPGFGDVRQAEAKLRNKINIVAARGALLLITVDDTDPRFAKSLANATAEAIRQRLAQISIQQAADKRAVAANRLADATIRLERAKQALTEFRVANHMPAPQAQLSAGVTILARLQADLQAKQAQLAALQQTATNDNIQVIATRAEIDNLQNQIAAAKSNTSNSNTNLQDLAKINLRYYDLDREYTTDELLYEVYSRYMDEVTIDELSATQNMNIVQPAFINPSRQLNTGAVGALALIALAFLGTEYYHAVSRHPGK